MSQQAQSTGHLTMAKLIEMRGLALREQQRAAEWLGHIDRRIQSLENQALRAQGRSLADLPTFRDSLPPPDTQPPYGMAQAISPADLTALRGRVALRPH